jgi:hypothetical protein
VKVREARTEMACGREEGEEPLEHSASEKDSGIAVELELEAIATEGEHQLAQDTSENPDDPCMVLMPPMLALSLLPQNVAGMGWQKLRQFSVHVLLNGFAVVAFTDRVEFLVVVGPIAAGSFFCGLPFEQLVQSLCAVLFVNKTDALIQNSNNNLVPPHPCSSCYHRVIFLPAC